MTVTVEDLYELATLYLFAQHGDQDQRQPREDAFKERLRFLSEADPENDKHIQLNLGRVIERIRPRVQEFVAAHPGSLPHADLKRYVEEETTEVRLQGALNEEEFEEEVREKWLNPETLATSAFRKARTPIHWLRQISYDPNLGWNSDIRTDRKAYIFSCFSEIAYLKFTKFDIPIKENRYKVIPSEVLENLRTYNMEYDLEKVLQSVTGGEGLTVAVNDPGRGFLYATFRTPHFVVVAVRGTSSLSEALLIDLDTAMDKEGYHHGFHREARTAMPELKRQSALIEAERNKQPVYFTGHSMGAAVAWIFRHIWGNSHWVMTPYIYASPRIGSYLVNDLYPIYAYTHPYDAVPHLPPLNLEYESPRDAITLAEGEAKWSRWFKLRKNHAIERYRLTLGKKTKDEQFDPDVYFTALFAELIDTHRQLGQPFPFGLRK